MMFEQNIITVRGIISVSFTVSSLGIRVSVMKTRSAFVSTIRLFISIFLLPHDWALKYKNFRHFESPGICIACIYIDKITFVDSVC